MSMLLTLRNLFSQYEFKAVRAREIIGYDGAGEFAMLRFWGLIEEHGKLKWRITTKGVDFIFGRLSVQKYVYIYNNEILH